MIQFPVSGAPTAVFVANDIDAAWDELGPHLLHDAQTAASYRPRDDSVAMVQREFPDVKCIVSTVNLGFGAANNLGFQAARGRYFVLLNSDAFLCPGSLRLSVERMDADARIGIGGARLVGRDNSWQPSARMFPSVLNDFLTLSGLAAKFPKSKFFGRFDRTWADQNVATEVDWVPGAYSIVRANALAKVGAFDPAFFLYCEEVDLCRRFKAAGYTIWYWADVVVIHIGGESSRQVKSLEMSSSGSQLTLWRMRSVLLYYRKHHGATAWLARGFESWWFRLRALRNQFSSDPDRQAKARSSKMMADRMAQAWKETQGGRVSPPRPW